MYQCQIQWSDGGRFFFLYVLAILQFQLSKSSKGTDGGLFLSLYRKFLIFNFFYSIVGHLIVF